MDVVSVRFDVVLIFFIYGLSFFSMGMALALESGRSPILVEKRVLLPLALFGLLHGMHEWLEIFLLQGIWVGLPLPQWLSGLRVILLTLSFIPLVVFGISQLSSSTRNFPRPIGMVATLLILYPLVLFLFVKDDPENWMIRADILARYLLAAPGGFLAYLALNSLAHEVHAENRMYLVRLFRWAALGFGVYGATQIFVNAADVFPARWINAELFFETTGLPIQIVRAGMAVLIMVNLLRAAHVIEGEREKQLLGAQEARLYAMEQMQSELAGREAMRRELLRHTVLAQEEERARIARELHDETAQILTAFSLNLASIRKAVLENGGPVEAVERLQLLSRQMSQGIYRLVHDLRPAQLDDLGLVPALQHLADMERQRLGLEVLFQMEGDRQRLDPLVETVIFRAAQEALTNVSRHAGVKKARLRLLFTSTNVVLQVCDEGVGFDPAQISTPLPGWGLAGIQERAETVGGQFNLHTAHGKGTTVELIVPIAVEAS